MKPNGNFDALSEDYLFAGVAKKIAAFSKLHNGGRKIIRLGIGDVTLPLCRAAVEAMVSAALELEKSETFKGYGPEQGYEFLRTPIALEYEARGVHLDLDEIFINDGIKGELGTISELFERENTVLISDPVYPVYADTNIISGREILFADALPSNNYLPLPDADVHTQLIYICSPNNPTGAVYDRDGLGKWVKYALENEALILFDAAYEAFIDSEKYPQYPHSIYEIEDAKKCAVELRSFSKSAGFTGVRCGFTVVPKDICFDGRNFNRLFRRYGSVKSNGVSYITQRGAAAMFTPEGRSQAEANIRYYKNNAKRLATAFDRLGIRHTSGDSSPYIWLECPHNMSGYEYFDYLLENYGIAGTPGEGFGKNGSGCLRISSFGNADDVSSAVERLLGK